MKRIITLLLISLAGCADSEKQKPESENHIDAARNFIRAALDGKFNDARRFMLQDSVNLNYMDVVERAFQNLDPETKNGYRSSSIRILKKTNIDDSTAIVIYSNTFKNDPDTLKVLKQGSHWLVDLKYLYQHDFDTTVKAAKDTVP